MTPCVSYDGHKGNPDSPEPASVHSVCAGESIFCLKEDMRELLNIALLGLFHLTKELH